MTQMTTSAARVVDPVLTNIAQGFQNNEMIGSAIFPAVPVIQRAGKIITFGKEAFFSYDTARAPGSPVKRIQIGYGSGAFAITDHGLAAIVPRELMEEAHEGVPSIDLASASITTVMNALRLRLEIEQATLATTAGNYSTNNKVTLSGTSQWSDLTSGVSDPIKDVEVAKEAIRAATGKRPNVVLMGAAVWAKLKQHPKIIDRMKYTGRDIPDTTIVASIFGVDRVLIGDTIQSTDAGVLSDVWGKYVVVAYTDMSGITDLGRPTFGYTYQLRGYPYVESPRYDADFRTWVYDVADATKAVITAQDAGYLISAAVA